MVVGDFHFGRLPVFPTENQAPLLIDSHAPKTVKIAGKGFQPVAGRDPQVGQEIGRVKLPESQECPLLNISRQFLRPTAIPDLFGFPCMRNPQSREERYRFRV
jgi:hypothetical protein